MEFDRRIAGVQVVHLTETDSTNAYIKRLLQKDAPPMPLAVVADMQTKGRGRLGRHFVSPEGGLYLSVLLPASSPEKALHMTPLAAVAVCRVLREYGVDGCIKWVNDVYVGQKKVCGILCEGVPGGVIVGIGVNITTPPGGFPESAGPAGAVNHPHITRSVLLEGILQELHRAAEDVPAALAFYRQHALLTGKQVHCTVGDRQIAGKAVDIDDHFGLIIETKEGEMMTINSGEVTRVRQSGAAAFFDFDGTMRKGDSIVQYVPYARKKGYMTAGDLLITLFWVMMYLLKRVPKKRAKTAALRFWMRMTEEERQALDTAFAQKIVDEVFPDALKKWEEMRREGYKLVLLSASTENYMQYVAALLQADALLCTPIEPDGTVVENCHGPEKVRRAEAYARFAGVDFEKSCAFGDTEGDIHILTRVGKGYAVNPTGKLADLAREKQLDMLNWQ